MVIPSMTSDTCTGARPLPPARRDRYLARVGLTPEELRPLDETALRTLVAAHVATVPFENTRIHRGEAASVDPARIYERLVTRHAGGICYELNGGLAALLAGLGARSALVAGAVVGPSGATGVPLGHAACVVTVGGACWLADVGFGGEGLLVPLPERRTRLHTPSGASYEVDPRPRDLSDFEAMAWWHSTSPRSRFTSSVVVSTTSGGRTTTLAGSGQPLSFHLRTTGGGQRELTPAAAQRTARDLFGLREPLPHTLIRYAPASVEASR
ncbi:arylamine N-acetyltransferase family protein [Micromonospora sp. CA-263727]|uniref:arylamine N-acetyltransferase family protein n=1 Tax=Micromonospora sp. CA-263727 TaxID=3239967 RepID=UPI003D8F8982